MARYLLDTHALIFWSAKKWGSGEFIALLDRQANQSNVLVSAISFWEAALLSKKGRIQVSDIHEWKSGLLENANIQLVTPSATDMIDSTLLPDHYKNPFDRLLIVQAQQHKAPCFG